MSNVACGNANKHKIGKTSRSIAVLGTVLVTVQELQQAIELIGE